MEAYLIEIHQHRPHSVAVQEKTLLTPSGDMLVWRCGYINVDGTNCGVMWTEFATHIPEYGSHVYPRPERIG